jgi:hypothetical protein
LIRRGIFATGDSADFFFPTAMFDRAGLQEIIYELILLLWIWNRQIRIIASPKQNGFAVYLH